MHYEPSHEHIRQKMSFLTFYEKKCWIGGFNMLVDEINNLREVLNEQVENCSLDNESLLALSQDLDKLIVEYYKDVLMV